MSGIPLHILLAVAGELWALDKTKLDEMMAFLISYAEGHRADASELEAKLSQKRERAAARSDGKVAILPIFGMLMPRIESMNVSERGTPVAQAAQVFRGLLADDSVSVIVGHFDTPGGLANGIEEFAQEIFDARGIKPLVAQVDSLAASAGYWLATAFDEIVASPSSSVGSIGVYTVHDDVTAALARLGVKRTVIKSSKSPHKAECAPGTGPLSEDTIGHIQSRVDAMDGMFARSVARGRGVNVKKVYEEFGGGRTFDAQEALKRGMVDRIEPMAATLRRFGVETSPAMAKRSATLAMRAKIALGEKITASDLEGHLREEGLPGAFAKQIASLGLRDPDPRDADSPTKASQPGSLSPAASDVSAITEHLRGFKLPSLSKD